MGPGCHRSILCILQSTTTFGGCRIKGNVHGERDDGSASIIECMFAYHFQLKLDRAGRFAVTIAEEEAKFGRLAVL